MPADLLVAVVLAATAALSVVPDIGSPVHWSPDALYYEAQKLEVQGHDQREARSTVFASDIAGQVKARERDLPPRLRRVTDPAWVEYSERFYRRRWTVPAAAAALDPVAHEDSLELVSLLGYVAFGPLIFLLLRRRFPTALSGGVAAACLLVPPLREASDNAGTDTWGVALLVAALLCAALVLDRGTRWLPLWLLSLLALSFTRDLAAVAVAGAAWVALRERSAPSLALAGGGVLALLPALLVGGVPLTDNLAYVLNDYAIPGDTSWSYIAGHYPSGLWELVRYNLEYPLEFAFPPPVVVGGLAAIAGTVALYRLPANGDPYVSLHRAAMLAAFATVFVAVNYTNWRIELVLVPMGAVGFARGFVWLQGRARRNERRAAAARLPEAHSSAAPSPKSTTGAGAPTRRPGPGVRAWVRRFASSTTSSPRSRRRRAPARARPRRRRDPGAAARTRPRAAGH